MQPLLNSNNESDIPSGRAKGGVVMQLRLTLIGILSLFVTGSVSPATRAADAATATATINSISPTGVGASLGTVTFTDSAKGLVITPKLSGLPPGEHGFHIHEKGDCGPGLNQGKPAAGFAAGGHYDPVHTKKHLGPFSTAGHRGDLPVLVVGGQGDANLTVTAPHLTVAEIRGRSIMIHAGGDNYSDTPKPLGGGGARIACGVIH
jgi:Cu-Zn family superoxide dismutase